jgi:hypothetical protein
MKNTLETFPLTDFKEKIVKKEKILRSVHEGKLDFNSSFKDKIMEEMEESKGSHLYVIMKSKELIKCNSSPEIYRQDEHDVNGLLRKNLERASDDRKAKSKQKQNNRRTRR